MSMTREELRQWFAEWLDDYYDGLYSEDDLTPEVAESVLAALRSVSREQVEKVWRGEWIGDNDEKVGTIDGSPIKSATCSACGNWLVGSDEYDCAGYFCPACGAPMTDEAVEMVMERLEALYEKRKKSIDMTPICENAERKPR